VSEEITTMTHDYGPDELWHIWRNGVSLTNVADTYFNARTIRKYRRLEKLQSIGAQLKSTGKRFEEILNPPVGQTKGVPTPDRFYDHRNAYIELQRRMRSLVRDWVDNEQLIAVGFAMPRSHEDHPIRVPPDLWTAYHEIRTGQLHTNGLQVVDIRLIAQKQVNPTRKLAPTLTITAEKRSTPGRPSLKGEIISTYEYLRETGEVDFSGTMVQCCDLVRQNLIQEDPSIAKDSRGLGDKVLAKHLGSFFREDKEDHFSQ